MRDSVEPAPWPQIGGSRLSGIPWPVIAVGVIVLGLVLIFLLRQWMIEPYFRNESSGVIDPCNMTSAYICRELDDLRLRVDYPKKLRIDDRGVQTGKRIVISMLQTRTPTDERFDLAVAPVTNTVHFLDKEGRDVSGGLTITATQGIPSPASLYVEHPGTLLERADRGVSMVVRIMPPTRNITQPITVTNPFQIELETTAGKRGQDIMVMVLERLSLGSILVLVGWLVAGWWERHPKMDRLYRRMQRHRANGNLQSVREQDCDEYVRLKAPFYPDSRIEKLYGEVAADYEYDAAFRVLEGNGKKKGVRSAQVSSEWIRRALHRTADARKWNPRDEKVRALQSVLTQVLDGGMVSEKVAAWTYPIFEQDLLDHSSPEHIRVQLVRLLRSFAQPEAKATIEKVLDHDPSPAVQVEAAWALAEYSGPQAEDLRRASPTVVREWLDAFRSPLVHNPFEAASAERDARLEEHFFEHPAYEQLYGPFSVALFAASGAGKTSSRLMLTLRYQAEHPEVLVVVYTEFSDLIRRGRRVSAQDHVRRILHCAAAQAAISLEEGSLSGEPYLESLQHFIEQIRSLGYREMCVLVDNIDGYADTQANPQMAENLARHLVGNFDLLEVPRLYLKLFLPGHLQEALMKYGGLTSGRIRAVELEWTEDQLVALLKRRLQQASPRLRLAESLRVLAVPLAEPERDLEPWDIDEHLVRQARGSPRRLVRLADLLLGHRARTWAETGKKDTELHIRRADWAIVLEHWFARERGEQRGT